MTDINSRTLHTGRKPATYLARAGLALFLASIILLVLAGPGYRVGIWGLGTGFSLLKYGAYGSLATLILSLAGLFVSARGRHAMGIIVSLVGILAATVVVAIPVSLMLKAKSVPPIHDITTDIVNPPRFSAILPLRAGAKNPAEYGGPEIAVKQREAYPDVKTLVVNAPPAQVFARALEAAHRMGWNIVASLPGEGRIEATDTTFWFGFTDDIVIRISPAEHRSLVDIRSVSRVGISDLGANAKRIRSFQKILAQNG